MFELKLFIFVLVAIGVAVIFIKKINIWGLSLHDYMLDNANKAFGKGMGWERPWTIILSKAMVAFFGLMFVVGIYVLIFSL